MVDRRNSDAGFYCQRTKDLCLLRSERGSKCDPVAVEQALEQLSAVFDVSQETRNERRSIFSSWFGLNKSFWKDASWTCFAFSDTKDKQ